MDHSTSQIDKVTFKLFSELEAKKLSVLPVTSVQTFDPLGHPFENGLQDTALGPLKRNDFCKTCGLTDTGCLGHFGHIQLPLPVFNPFLMKQVYQVLKMFCFNCHHLLFTPFNVELYIAQLRSLDLGLDYILDDIFHYANDISNSTTGVDWSTLESRMFLRNKLNEMINSECKKKEKEMNSLKLENQETKSKQEQTDLSNVANLETVEIVNTKNIVEKKVQMFKDFFGAKIIKPTKVCVHCNQRKRGLSVINKSLIIMTGTGKTIRNVQGEDDLENDQKENLLINNLKGKSYLTPSQAREHLRKLWQNENEVLLRLFPFLDIDISQEKITDERCPMDVFFWETIIVPPNRFRPLRHMNGRSFEHQQTSALNEILMVSKTLEMSLENAKKNSTANSTQGQMIARFYQQWQRLQILCNRIYDSQMDNLPDKKSTGVKQILEKKEGLMRLKMMGKRVNFAARSVISPDPFIMADEIGIPVIFAMKLSYPQPVTNWNVKQLQKMIINGPNKHPGALSITYEDGYTVRLKPDDIQQRRSIATTIQPPSFSHGLNGVKIVNRHLVSGDVLLLNRQPTLHKPSIMAHKARVLPKEKTLRLHYANCKCYNADFDGDEMNAHFPQSELARAEAYNIASVNYQFLVPKDGSPLSGLIQDHVVAGVLLSIRGQFFNKSDYQELIYGALSFLNKPIKFLPASIVHPKKLWSGKQIISTLVINLIPANKPLPSLENESKVSAKLLITKKPRSWTSGGPLFEKEMCESQVIFRHGELLCGIMDKVNFGATKNGLIHVCYELYGGDIHSKLLTAIARLCTNFLQSQHGFTLGIHDILVKQKPDSKRRKLIKQTKSIGLNAVAEAFNISMDEEIVQELLQTVHTSRNSFPMKQLDAAYKSKTDLLSNEITQHCMPKGLLKTFPANNLQMMIETGAKGASANAIQISCLLGQIELEGRRIPLMMSGRTLPSFRPYETQPRAGGFVTGRFLSGIRPQEFFFHCMAGREGLIDTAVKTSRSGYLQRCLIKHLEGLMVNYDLTVRDAEGSVIQWLYGEDGLDILKSQSLKKPFLTTILNNKDTLKPSKDEMDKLKLVQNPTLQREIKKTQKYQKTYGHVDLKCRTEWTSPFLMFEHENRLENLTKNELIKIWYNLSEKQRQHYHRSVIKPIDPIIMKYRPDSNVGAISEQLSKLIDDYIKSKNVAKSTAKEFRETINVRFMRSLCDPGEAVGLLAAQSIGEPSTQMTLNTFHFAGRGEMNVTLGVPRLRELLMTASKNISTPSMDIPFRTDVDGLNLEEEAETVRLKMNAVRLKDLLEYVDINEKYEINEQCSRVYDIRFVFLPRRFYKKRYFTNPTKVLHFMEMKFLRQLLDALNRRITLLNKSYGLFDVKSASSRTTAISRSSTKKRTSEEDEEVVMNQPQQDDNDEENDVKTKFDDDEDDDDDLDDYDVDEGDGDTTAMRQRAKINQEREYEEPDDEEVDENNDDDFEEDSSQIDDNDQRITDNDDFQDENDEDLELTSKDLLKIKQEILDDVEEQLIINNQQKKQMSEQKRSEKRKNLEVSAKDRRLRVLNISPGCIVDYNFDMDHELWCEVKLKFPLISGRLDLRTLVEEEANRAFVHRVGRLNRVFLVKDNDASQRGQSFCKMIKTEGVSMAHMFKFERLLDLRRIYTNDMHAIANTYGIEAARAALIREIKNVFAPYGISVDGRHLSLIADHMTFTGTIKGMNRGAMDGISPLQAMSFETTTNFLKNSLLLCLKDDLRSPSSRIVIGRPSVLGTGMFETRLKPKSAQFTGLQMKSAMFPILSRSSMLDSIGMIAAHHNAQPSSSRSSMSFLSQSMLAPSLFSTPGASSMRKRSRVKVFSNEQSQGKQNELNQEGNQSSNFKIKQELQTEYEENFTNDFGKNKKIKLAKQVKTEIED